jgi:putative flippase GtrA
LTFCLVGGSGVLVNMLAFWTVRHVFVGPGALGDNIAVVAGWLVSVASNFTLNHFFTFRETTRGSSIRVRRRLAAYYASALAGLSVQWCIFQASRWAIRHALAGADFTPARQIVEFEAGLSNLVGIGFATIITYTLSKRLVFRGEPISQKITAE